MAGSINRPPFPSEGMGLFERYAWDAREIGVFGWTAIVIGSFVAMAFLNSVLLGLLFGLGGVASRGITRTDSDESR